MFCLDPGTCYGEFLGKFDVETSDECLGLCKTTPDCWWYSYRPKFGDCTLTKNCERISKRCLEDEWPNPECYFGRVDCDKENP